MGTLGATRESHFPNLTLLSGVTFRDTQSRRSSRDEYSGSRARFHSLMAVSPF